MLHMSYKLNEPKCKWSGGVHTSVNENWTHLKFKMQANKTKLNIYLFQSSILLIKNTGKGNSSMQFDHMRHAEN